MATDARQYCGVQEIWQKDEGTMGIVWTDGLEQSFDVVALRRNCPCAVCIDEMTGKKKLKDTEVPTSVRPRTVKSVGRYAMAIEFSDGHNTGIYTFDLMRRLGVAGANAGTSPSDA